MPFSLMNGLASLGQGVAKYAGEAGLDIQKSQLAQQGAILADQLATTREATGRVQAGEIAAAAADKEQGFRAGQTDKEQAFRAGQTDRELAARAGEGEKDRAFKAAEKAADRQHEAEVAAGVPFAGNSEFAASSRVLTRLQKSLQDGTISDENRRLYALAENNFTKPGAPQLITDPNDPTKQVLASIPGRLPEGFVPSTYRPDSGQKPSGGAAEPSGKTDDPKQGSSDTPQKPNVTGQPSGGQGAPIVVPGTQRSKDLTQDQARAGTYADRMVASNAVMEKLADAAGSWTQRRLAEGGAVLGTTALNSAEFQKVDQAQRDFATAVLRLESGAVIGDSEFENARKQYFPQPGDTAEVIAQKAANRQRSITGFMREAGPSYKPPETAAPTTPAKSAAPKPPAIGDVQQGYMFSGGDPADPGAWKAVK